MRIGSLKIETFLYTRPESVVWCWVILHGVPPTLNNNIQPNIVRCVGAEVYHQQNGIPPSFRRNVDTNFPDQWTRRRASADLHPLDLHL